MLFIRIKRVGLARRWGSGFNVSCIPLCISRERHQISIVPTHDSVRVLEDYSTCQSFQCKPPQCCQGNLWLAAHALLRTTKFAPSYKSARRPSDLLHSWVSSRLLNGTDSSYSLPHATGWHL